MQIIVFFVVCIFFSLIYYTIRLGISPMPTSFRVLRALDKILPKIDQGVIVEMGSGWGHVAFFLACKYKKSQVIGYEKSFVPFFFSKIFLIGARNLTFKRADFKEICIENADLVYCYLFPRAMELIAKKKRNGILISNTFFLPKGKLEKEIILHDIYRTKIYRYEVGVMEVSSVIL